MKQKLKRFMAGFMAMLTLVGTLFTNGTTAFAASPQANIAFWNASVKNSGEVSELKPGYNHGKILYSILDGNSAYCMNFGLRADDSSYIRRIVKGMLRINRSILYKSYRNHIKLEVILLWHQTPPPLQTRHG